MIIALLQLTNVLADKAIVLYYHSHKYDTNAIHSTTRSRACMCCILKGTSPHPDCRFLGNKNKTAIWIVGSYQRIDKCCPEIDSGLLKKQM